MACLMRWWGVSGSVVGDLVVQSNVVVVERFGVDQAERANGGELFVCEDWSA